MTETPMAASAPPLPSSVENRLDVLDALRGFALLGIFIANMRIFAGWEFLSLTQRAALAGGEPNLYEFLHIALTDGKFYTIFSLLFGIGFSLQLARIAQKGGKGVGLYLRRLTVLLVIGAVHLFFIWAGDILTAYAVLGFILLPLNRFSDRTILWIAGFCFALPVIGYVVAWQLGIAMDLGFYQRGFTVMTQIQPDFRGDIAAMIAEDGWQGTWAFIASGGLIRTGYILESWRLPKVLFVMLIGLWVGRQIIKGRLINDTKFLARVAVIGLMIGVPFGYAYTQLGVVTAFAPPPDMVGLFRILSYMLSVFPVGFAYAAIFVLLWNKGASFLKIFAAPGRMALTHYLSQTFIGIWLFYGIGLGMIGTFTPLQFVLTAVVIFSIQAVLSFLWLSTFKYGPLEWVWRCLTYGKVLPIRK